MFPMLMMALLVLPGLGLLGNPPDQRGLTDALETQTTTSNHHIVRRG